MAYDYDYKTFVLVTNCFNEGEDCMFFTCNVTMEDIEKALKAKGTHFDDISSIKETEISYYCFDPVYGTPSLEANILKAASTYKQ